MVEVGVLLTLALVLVDIARVTFHNRAVLIS
jgi:hypothetical protein